LRGGAVRHLDQRQPLLGEGVIIAVNLVNRICISPGSGGIYIYTHSRDNRISGGTFLPYGYLQILQGGVADRALKLKRLGGIVRGEPCRAEHAFIFLQYSGYQR